MILKRGLFAARTSASAAFSLFSLLLLCFAVFIFCTPLYADETPAASHLPTERSGDAHYSLPIFPNGSILRNPNSGIAGYFEVHEGTAVKGSATLDLWYSYSPIVIPEISTMTVSVNGTPVDSRILVVDGAAKSNWKLSIPEADFQGGVNEVEVSVVHRTIDGLCRDIDNDANWFIIKPESRLLLSLEKSPDKLASFPRPYTDSYTPERMNTVVYLPHDFGNDTISEMLNIATLLGRNSQPGLAPGRLQVRTGSPGRVDANEIVLGRADEWLSDAVLSDDEVMIAFKNLPSGRARLVIAASDDRGLAKGVGALSRPNLVRTFMSNQVRLSSPLPAGRDSGRTVAGGKREVFTLEDFGYDTDIRVSGAFHQEAQFFIPRPPNYRAAGDSYVDLHFRHSSVLDPKKSAVTVYINEIPIRAATLRSENANGGVLRAPIPASELVSPFWNIRFAFYHDLGIIDCSKRYDDVAWSVVDKKTSIFLKRGDIPYTPTWENFPNDFHSDAKGDISLTLLMAGEPNDRALNSALRLAYYIGLNNAAEISWRVMDLDDFDASKIPGTALAIGAKGAKGWSSLEEYLSIYPKKGSYRVEDWLEIAPDVIGNFDIYQVAKLDNDKWLYAFMYETDARFQNLLDFSFRAPMPLAGQLSLVDRDGKAAPYWRETQISEKRIEWFDYIAARIGGTAAVYAIVLAAVILITLLIMVFSMRRGRTG